MDIQREIKLFKQVYDDAMYAPQLRWNPKYESAQFAGMTPYICINDICVTLNSRDLYAINSVVMFEAFDTSFDGRLNSLR